MVERRIRAARFPAVKSVDTFDFPVIPSVNKALIMELARCENVQRRENVIAGLVHELSEARDERRLLNVQRQVSRLNLLVIDEPRPSRPSTAPGAQEPARGSCNSAGAHWQEYLSSRYEDSE